MKQIRSLVTGLAACALMLAMTQTTSAQTEQDGMAKVINIRGDARYMTGPSDSWQKLKVGMVLKQGAIIQTAAKSHVDLVFNNSKAFAIPTPVVSDMSYSAPKAQQDAVRVLENTVLGIDRLKVMDTGADTVTETRLDLKAGRIFGTVKKLSPASTYEVQLPNGVAGIRGTVYFLSAEGVLSVLSGSVVLAYVTADGTVATQEVTAGQQFDARTGQLTPIPERMLRELGLMAAAFHGPTTPTSFTVDHRIYHVSPTSPGIGFGPE